MLGWMLTTLYHAQHCRRNGTPSDKFGMHSAKKHELHQDAELIQSTREPPEFETCISLVQPN